MLDIAAEIIVIAAKVQFLQVERSDRSSECVGVRCTMDDGGSLLV